MTTGEEQESKQLKEMVAKACLTLGDHFDSVVIIATKQYGDDYVRYTSTNGSSYATYGAVKEYALMRDEQYKKRALE